MPTGLHYPADVSDVLQIGEGARGEETGRGLASLNRLTLAPVEQRWGWGGSERSDVACGGKRW